MKKLVTLPANDVLRHDGAARVYMTTLRFLGTMHDFMMLNPLLNKPATLAGSMFNQASAK